jgi:hypothetical protein
LSYIKSECNVDVLAAEKLSLVMRDNSHDEEGNANVNAHELITNDRGEVSLHDRAYGKKAKLLCWTLKHTDA